MSMFKCVSIFQAGVETPGRIVVRQPHPSPQLRSMKLSPFNNAGVSPPNLLVPHFNILLHLPPLTKRCLRHPLQTLYETLTLWLVSPGTGTGCHAEWTELIAILCVCVCVCWVMAWGLDVCE